MDNLVFNSTELNITNKEIIITKTNRGRKTNLFISGWKIDNEARKEHLKNLKKKLGCNGSIKQELIEGTEETVIHLQGNHTEKVVNYIKENADNMYSINIK